MAFYGYMASHCFHLSMLTPLVSVLASTIPQLLPFYGERAVPGRPLGNSPVRSRPQFCLAKMTTNDLYKLSVGLWMTVRSPCLNTSIYRAQNVQKPLIRSSGYFVVDAKYLEIVMRKSRTFETKIPRFSIQSECKHTFSGICFAQLLNKYSSSACLFTVGRNSSLILNLAE